SVRQKSLQKALTLFGSSVMIHFVSQPYVKAIVDMSKNTIPVNGGAMPNYGRHAEPNFTSKAHMNTERRSFIGGSDARTIMGTDEPRLIRLWQEKRGEVDPEDLSQ